jgi:hypothetical protein
LFQETAAWAPEVVTKGSGGSEKSVGIKLTTESGKSITIRKETLDAIAAIPSAARRKEYDALLEMKSKVEQNSKWDEIVVKIDNPNASSEKGTIGPEAGEGEESKKIVIFQAKHGAAGKLKKDVAGSDKILKDLEAFMRDAYKEAAIRHYTKEELRKTRGTSPPSTPVPQSPMQRFVHKAVSAFTPSTWKQISLFGQPAATPPPPGGTE